MAKTKDRIANDMYGEDFGYLSGGEKAAVTRAFNAQGSSPARAPARRAGSVVATVGRVGVNGTQKCILESGATVQDLLGQAGMSLDEDKEAVNAQSTGLPVDLDSKVKNGETYVITPEIKSA